MRRRRNQNYPFEEKKLVVTEYLSDRYDQVPLKEFARVVGIHCDTIRSWLRKIEWDLSNIDRLRCRRRKKSAPESVTSLPAPVQRLILQVKDRFPSWGPLKIKQYLFRHEQQLVPQTSIYRFLKGRGLVQQRPTKSAGEGGHTRSFEYPYPLAAVQMDLMHLTLSSGETIYLMSLLDDYSRFVVGNRFSPVKTMDEAMVALKEAMSTYGVMERLLTDHGSEFVSWQRFTAFEDLLAQLDIEHIASGPQKKENQGKVERWHATVREGLREHGPMDYSSQAQLWIRQVTDVYNYERPHQALGGLVPADRFFGISDDLQAELQRCAGQKPAHKRIYFTCSVGDQHMVVSGQRADRLSVFVNGVRLGTDVAGADLAGLASELDGATLCRDSAEPDSSRPDNGAPSSEDQVSIEDDQ